MRGRFCVLTFLPLPLIFSLSPTIPYTVSFVTLTQRRVALLAFRMHPNSRLLWVLSRGLDLNLVL
jgi:hypothetical protein